MFFRLDYTIRDFIITQTKPIEFIFEGERKRRIYVVIRSPNEQERQRGHKATDAFCEARLEVTPSDKNEEVFAKIEKNEIINTSNHSAIKYKGENNSEIQLPSLSEFPDYFQSFTQQIFQELSGAAFGFVKALRWRINYPGIHNPIRSRIGGSKWSKDGSFWHPLPDNFSVAFGDEFTDIFLTEEVKTQVSLLVKSSGGEPVYHELFREAWEQQSNSPRSAIVIGMSAAEVAVKNLIATLVPDAKWLIGKIPSPPLIKMLNDFVPNLPALNKINNKVVFPQQSIVKTLEKGVTIRNDIVHIGAKAPKPETVENVLLAVKDLLWLADYYCGHDWALDFLSEETCKELGL